MGLSWQESLFDEPLPARAVPAPSSRGRATPRPDEPAERQDGAREGRDGREPEAVPRSWDVDVVPPPAAPLVVDRVRRVVLDDRSWLDVARGWYPDHAALFAELLDTAPWRSRTRHMYDRVVLEPRLVAAWGADDLADLPTPLARIRAAVGERYEVEFDSVLVNLYRDGRDGVAWHGDTVRHRLDRTVVVTVALGERRRFLLRPGTAGPPAHTLTSGQGDLVVMGGRCQHEWQHTVPKAARAGARMSITLRHSRPLPPTRPAG